MTQERVTQAPMTQAPMTQERMTQAPMTQAPMTQAPMTQALVTAQALAKARELVTTRARMTALETMPATEVPEPVAAQAWETIVEPLLLSAAVPATKFSCIAWTTASTASTVQKTDTSAAGSMHRLATHAHPHLQAWERRTLPVLIPGNALSTEPLRQSLQPERCTSMLRSRQIQLPVCGANGCPGEAILNKIERFLGAQ
jgi:hypothetical protein